METLEEMRVEIRPLFPRDRGKWSGEAAGGGLNGEQVAGAGVAARVAELGHGPGFDLADALPGQVEVLADLFEGAGLASVEAETEAQDLALALVERAEELGDLLGQKGGW